MDKFIVISCNEAKQFQKEVNDALNKGYKLHGEPNFIATSHPQNYNNPDGTTSLYSTKKEHYCQCLMLELTK
jgi:hypothetical protein